MKVTTLEVSKGISTPAGNVAYRVVMDTSDLDAKEVAGARLGAEAMIDEWLSQSTQRRPVQAPSTPAATFNPADLPTDVAELDNLPWLAKNKQKPEQGAWGWILTDPARHIEADSKVVQKLIAAIQAYNGTVTIGQYDYKLNGDKKQFIHRYPHKEQGAR